MRQCRLMSFVETTTTLGVGYGVSVDSQFVAFPWFGLSVNLGDALGIGAVFSVLSLVRGYLLRRLCSTDFEPTGSGTAVNPPSALNRLGHHSQAHLFP